jgi:DNA-binding protein HU-beta
MTKAEIVEQVANGTGLTRIETEAVIEGFMDTVIEALSKGNRIEIRGFGSFKVKKKNGRIARNPRTGETVKVDDHFVPVFKFSREFKDQVNDGNQKLQKGEDA